MKVFVGLGSNLGDRLETLRRACEALGAEAGIDLVDASAVYETEPVGPGDQQRYLNAAVALETSLEPQVLLGRLLEIERVLGRDRSADAVRWGPRTIDLDLLLAGDHQIEGPGLEVPHPRLHERAFVLVPLADIAADVVHAGSGRTISELLARAAGRAGVELVPGVSLPSGSD